jgi:hypothetical protein
MSKLTIAAAGALLSACLLAGPAQAMPTSNLAQAAQEVANVQSVAWVCNPWGRCWWRPNYYYYSYAPPLVVSPRVWGGPVYARSWGGGWGYRRGWYGRRGWW